MRAAITGTTGYIGGNLEQALNDRGWAVTALTRGMDQDQMAEVLRDRRIDVVIHLASLFIAEHKSEDVEGLVSSNLLFGANVLEAMKRAGLSRFINTGTSWQNYQTAERDPVCLYAATKNAFEELLRYYVNAEGFRAVTLKIFDTYGPRDHRAKLIPKLLSNFETMMPLELSEGKQKIDFVHIRDIIEAYVIACERVRGLPEKTSETFSLSSGQLLTLREVIAEIEKNKGQKFSIRWGARPYRKREVMIPWTGGEALPGWKAKISFSEGIRELVANC